MAMMDKETLVTLTADVVAAHVSNNSVSVSDMPNLVQQVHLALAGLSKTADPQQESRQPIVSVRSSIKPDSLTCLVCGQKQKTLKRHLSTAHGLTPAAYRQEFDLPASYPMTAPAYSERRRDMAKQIGLGRKKGARRGAATGTKRGKG